ncbi:hypothetical protein [Comamonas sp. JC664]|uniref:hypothetical protein n=1 Tax=Comamonas sp. JC664 TaxID=2801917 RepID=UPI00336A5054
MDLLRQLLERGLKDVRLVIAAALEVTGGWDERRYPDMSLLKSTPDTAAAGCHQGASPRPPSEPTTHDSELDRFRPPRTCRRRCRSLRGHP